jgi:hypothetical protein
MTDYEKLLKVLNGIGIPYETYEKDEISSEYKDITINANASDKYVTITFKNGKFSYSN